MAVIVQYLATVTKNTAVIDQGKVLNKMPSLTYCKKLFANQMKKQLIQGEEWLIEVEVINFDSISNEQEELIEIVQPK